MPLPETTNKKLGTLDARKGPQDLQAQLSDEEKAAYTALMRVVFAVPRVVTAAIAPEAGIGLSDHLVLQNLSDAPGRRMRVTELATACGVSGSGITRILNRLTKPD
jgi:hypothetical protein